jgi:hypothetical protein
LKNIDEVKKYISNWAQFSPRMKKLLEMNNISV